MSWSSGFIAELGAAVKMPQWELAAERSVFGGSSTVYTSHAQTVSGSPALIVSAPIVTPNRIQPVSWTPSAGTWSVRIGWEDAHHAIASCPRGSIVGLYCTLAGNRERVALGVVRNLSGTSQDFAIECQSLTTALTGRLTTDKNEVALFHELADGDTTVAGGGYTAGAGAITVTSAAQWTKDSDGGKYCALVTPDSGDPFFVIGSGLAGNVLTIDTAGAFGTTDADASAGNAVTHCAYITGHPLDIARKILISGSSTSPTWDTLPDDWGLACDGGWFDHGDTNDVRDLVITASSGSYVWDVVVTAEIDNAWSWFSALLSRIGAWLTMRQGSMTFRAAQDTTSPALPASGSITSRGLLKGPRPAWSWQCHAQEFSVEYGRVVVRTDATTGWTAGTSTRVESFPALYEYEYDTTGLVFENQPAMRTDDVARLRYWATDPPEAFTLALRGWAAGAFCDGDLVDLSIPELRGLVTAGGGAYEDRTAMVLESSPNWGGDDCRLRVIPSRQEK